jgi:chromosome segregation ATPase
MADSPTETGAGDVQEACQDITDALAELRSLRSSVALLPKIDRVLSALRIAEDREDVAVRVANAKVREAEAQREKLAAELATLTSSRDGLAAEIAARRATVQSAQAIIDRGQALCVEISDAERKLAALNLEQVVRNAECEELCAKAARYTAEVARQADAVANGNRVIEQAKTAQRFVDEVRGRIRAADAARAAAAPPAAA